LLFEAGIAENFLDPLRPLAARDFVEGGKKFEVLARGETREERALGGDGDADLPPDFTGIAPGIEAAHAYRSSIGQEHGRDQLEGRGFSAAVRAEQHQTSAPAEKKRSFKATVSPPRSRPSQLNRAGRWRNILRTDSKTTRSMKVERRSASGFGRAPKTLYYSGDSQTDSYQGMPSGLPLNALLLTRLRALDFES
jgi:hypothetical protein